MSPVTSSNPITLTLSQNISRLDKFLVEAIPERSRQQVKQMIKQGFVQIEGFNPKPSLALPAGTKVTLKLPEPEPTDWQAYVYPLTILYEDEAIIVVDKPAGLVVHPAVGHVHDTLVNALLHHYPSLAEIYKPLGSDGLQGFETTTDFDLDDERPGIVHRLDKDTSGALVVARNRAALINLQAQFENRSVGKIYLALVHGHPHVAAGLIDVPLARHPQYRQQMTAHPKGKPAQTHYQIVEVFPDYSLLELVLKTGRTHQIRVHLSWLGYPVVGDTLYGRKKNALLMTGHFLHAHRLEIDHPYTQTRLTFESPLPVELKEVLEKLR